jgi:uncharacterized protein
MQQRLSMVTLGVRDLTTAREFYESLGWRAQQVDETAFFQIGGLALVLWGSDKLAVDAGLAEQDLAGNSQPSGAAFRGVALAHNVHSRAEVDAIIDQAAAAGAVITRAPADTFYGGYAGWFQDPDGHLWEVAHNPGFPLDADGALTVPPLGDAP